MHYRKFVHSLRFLYSLLFPYLFHFIYVILPSRSKFLSLVVAHTRIRLFALHWAQISVAWSAIYLARELDELVQSSHALSTIWYKSTAMLARSETFALAIYIYLSLSLLFTTFISTLHLYYKYISIYTCEQVYKTPIFRLGVSCTLSWTISGLLIQLGPYIYKYIPYIQHLTTLDRPPLLVYLQCTNVHSIMWPNLSCLYTFAFISFCIFIYKKYISVIILL